MSSCKKRWKNLEIEERKIIGVRARETEINSKEGAKFEKHQLRPLTAYIKYENKIQ